MNNYELAGYILASATGTFLISVAVVYTAWSHVRLIFFRQDLFQVRDRLWDKARELNAFSDPAYVEARQKINDCIAAANWINAPAVLPPAESLPHYFTTENRDMRKAVQAAHRELTRRILRYVLLERASGWAYIARAVFARIFDVMRNGFGNLWFSWQDSTTSWVASDYPRLMHAMERQLKRAS